MVGGLAHTQNEVELFRAPGVVQLCAEHQVVDGTHIEGVPKLQELRGHLVALVEWNSTLSTCTCHSRMHLGKTHIS